MTVLLSLILSTLTFAGPASAGCDEPGERNNVQCSINHKKEKGGKGNDIYTGSKRTRLTISDQGGVDQLRLPNVSMSEARFSTKGSDLSVSFGRGNGSVLIKNHTGSGRIEAIRFAGENRVRFNKDGAILDGPSVTKATSDGKDLEFEKESRTRVSFSKTDDSVVIVFERETKQRGSSGIGSIISDIIDAVARALSGDSKQGGVVDDGTNGGQVRGADPGVGRGDLPDSF